MNAIVITIAINRVSKGQVQLEVTRRGHGDRSVTANADHMEKCIAAAGEELIRQNGGVDLTATANNWGHD